MHTGWRNPLISRPFTLPSNRHKSSRSLWVRKRLVRRRQTGADLFVTLTCVNECLLVFRQSLPHCRHFLKHIHVTLWTHLLLLQYDVLDQCIHECRYSQQTVKQLCGHKTQMLRLEEDTWCTHKYHCTGLWNMFSMKVPLYSSVLSDVRRSRTLLLVAFQNRTSDKLASHDFLSKEMAFAFGTV